MTDQNNATQAAEQDPLSDEYVNAVIQRHGYQSPETVIARLYQWMGRHGGENGVTLLMYEAHKALSKLRAPVAGEAQPVCWIEKDVLESVRDEGSDAWVYWRPAGHVAEHDEMPLFAAPQASASDFAKLQSAYVAACDRIGELLAAKQTSAAAAVETTDSRRQGLLEAIHRYGNARAMAEHNIAYRDEVRNTADALIALFDAAPLASEAVRNAALEEAAQALDRLHAENRQYHTEFRQAANVIRALKQPTGAGCTHPRAFRDTARQGYVCQDCGAFESETAAFHRRAQNGGAKP